MRCHGVELIGCFSGFVFAGNWFAKSSSTATTNIEPVLIPMRFIKYSRIHMQSVSNLEGAQALWQAGYMYRSCPFIFSVGLTAY